MANALPCNRSMQRSVNAMNRAYYIAGWGWVAICAALIARARSPVYVPFEPPITVTQAFGGSPAADWFTRVRPSCNDLEVGMRLQSDPAPEGWEGSGYAAACLAIAGRIEDARMTLLALREGDQSNAAGIVFNVGHPIADMGDDRSAGPIMRLVVEFQPWNYMALYHAGMSYYVLDQPDLARAHLDAFLEQYDVRDGWTANAREILRRLERGEGR